MVEKRIIRVADAVLRIEHELRVLQLWQEPAPSARALASTMPFCADTLELHQWLQWIFVPRMKYLIEHDAQLPQHSSIAAYAEECFSTRGERVRPLLIALQQFDALIEGG